MKVFIIGPNIDDPNQIGGIIAVIKTIISVINVNYKYYSRSPKMNYSGVGKIVDWTKKMSSFVKDCFVDKPDIIHIHTAMDNSALIRDFIWAILAKLSNSNVLLHIHGGKMLFKKPKQKGILFIINWHFKLANHILVLSDTEKKALKINYCINNDNISVVENAINYNEIPRMPTKPIEQNNLNIIFIGRICESKGIDDLITALIDLKNKGVKFHFKLYGQGELVDKTINKLKPVLMNDFSFHGIVHGIEKWNALNESDIFILPSRYGEGLPMALLEAMFLGKLVLVTNDASIGMVVFDQLTGFIVKKYSPASITDKIEQVIKMSDSDINKIVRNAKNLVIEKYSADKYIEKLEEVYLKFQ